jgi:hypothetical protein
VSVERLFVDETSGRFAIVEFDEDGNEIAETFGELDDGTEVPDAMSSTGQGGDAGVPTSGTP